MADAAVVAHVMVALPDADDALSVMVLGAVKFWSGAPKLQAGASFAFAGELVKAGAKVTVPANPFAPVTVMRQDPDIPGAETEIVADAQLGETLMPGCPTLTVTVPETALAE
jgi:hypothetical protein